MPELESINKIWIKFVPEKGKFGCKCISYYGEEFVKYADDVDFSFVFPARPRPGIATMNISRDGVVMEVRQPFVISGDKQVEGGKETLKLTLHHQK
ncbi:MAG: hypothetical protein Kow0069_21800 [Promethearchaeota archaeon]